MKLPTELQHIIASYVVTPVYRLPYPLKDHIYWEGLAHNPHPAMIPLIDNYFERCLTIQSHLDWTILHHLRCNPIAKPLLEKYEYFIIKYKVKVLCGYFERDCKPIIAIPWNGHTPTDWSKATSTDFSSHPLIMDYIREGTIRVKELSPVLKYALYQNPAIFEIEPQLTQDAYHAWIRQIKN